MNPVQDALRRHPSHVGQRLADGREPGVIECRRVDIVESDHRYISGYLHPRILQRTYRPYGRHVIEGDHGGETLPIGKQMLDNRVAQFGGTDVAVKLHSEFRSDRDAYFTSYLNDATPAFIGIQTERLAAHERNVSMSQRMQMCQGKFRRKAVVEYQVSDAIDRTVSSDGNHRNRERMLQQSINGNEGFRTSAEKHLTVFFY